MMIGRVFLVLTGACQFGHGVGGFTTNFIHSPPRDSSMAGRTSSPVLAGAFQFGMVRAGLQVGSFIPPPRPPQQQHGAFWHFPASSFP